MAELFEEVVAILESRSSTRALADEFKIDSEEAAGNGAVLGVPVFIAKLARWADDDAGCRTLLDALRSVDTSGLQDPGAAIEGRMYEPTGSELTELLIGEGRSQVATVISGEAGISERSASGLLPPTAWAVMASIADRYGNRLDRDSLLSILSEEENDLVDGGWGPWLEAVDDRSVAQLSMADHQGSVTLHETNGSTGTGEYPPPLARSDRQLRQPQRRPSAPAPAPAPEPQKAAASAGPMRNTGNYEGFGSARGLTDVDRDLDTPGSSRVFGLIILLLLFLLGLAALVWFLTRGGDDSAVDGGGNGTDTEVVTDSVPADGGAGVGADPGDAPDLASMEQLDVSVTMIDEKEFSDATGLAELTFNPEKSEVCYQIDAQRIGTPYDGHIHVGPSGIKGGIVVDFGPLDNGEISCLTIPANDMAAILDDLGGHYVEMHDPGGEFTIRSQLSDSVSDPGPAMADGAFDPDSGGATTVVTAGRISLEGAVADQATADLLLSEVAGLDPNEIEVVNNLTVVEGSPLPTGRIVVDDEILFAINSDQLASTQGTVIEDLSSLFKARPSWTMTVVGHTDSSGSPVYNLELSLRRAGAVRDALVELGVPSESLRIEGAGDTDPVGDNATPEGRAMNRRIEFVVDRG